MQACFSTLNLNIVIYHMNNLKIKPYDSLNIYRKIIWQNPKSILRKFLAS